MSDEPKPTKGEWTADDVACMDRWEVIADAHNAALDVAISEAHSEGRRKQAQYEVEHNQQPLVDALKLLLVTPASSRDSIIRNALAKVTGK